MKWRGAPICSSAPEAGHGPGLALRRQPLHPRPGPGEHGVSRPMGQRPRRIPQEPRAVHAGSRRARLRPADRDAEEGRAHDRRGQGRLHPLGDGRHAAHDGLGYLHGDFQSAAGHRQLHAAPAPGAYPLRGHNNVQGASDHGAHAGNCCPAIRRSTIPKCARASKRPGA